MLAGTHHSSSAVALDDCVVCFVPRLDFIGLVQSNKPFYNALPHLLATSFGNAEQQQLDLAYKPVRERLAKALLTLQETYGSPAAPESFSIIRARDDVASLVGTVK